MDMHKNAERFSGRTMTRRQAMRHVALGSLGLATIRLGRAQAAPPPSVFTWAGYDIPELFPGYAGPEPSFSIFSDPEEALLKVRGGFHADLAHPCVETARRWQSAEIMTPIDTKRLKNWDSLWPTFKTMEGTQIGDDQYIVPVDWGNNSVIYNTDLVEPREQSYSLLFDDRYKGRIAVQGATPFLVMAALYLGIPKPFAMTDDELAEVGKLLRSQRELVRFYWTSNTELEQAIVSGEILVASGWNISAANVTKEGINVHYMNPKEGIITWACGLVHLDSGEADEQAVYDLIDAYISPDAGQFMIEEYGTGHSNRDAWNLADRSRLVELGMDSPEALFDGGVWFAEPDAETLEKMVNLIDQIQIGN